ncbi:MAG: OsmC family protein [Actinomycetota bacterium]
MREVVAVWKGGYQCTVRARQFDLPTDEPPSVGGEDTGPMPTEVFLASLASCFCMAVYHVARKRNLELSSLEVSVSGEYEGPRFRRLRVDVRPGDEIDDLPRLLERAFAVCYVSNTLRNPPRLEIAVDDEVLVSHG